MKTHKDLDAWKFSVDLVTLLIAKNLEYISEEKYTEIVLKIETVGKLLNGLIKYLKSK